MIQENSLFLNWHKIHALRVVTHGSEQGMLEGYKKYRLSPLSDAPLPADEGFCDPLQFEAWPGVLRLIKINAKFFL